jgi:4-amino-4-deoxy-L-arabinose transferase-like glycosyltransferase
MSIASEYHQALTNGHLLYPLTNYDTYPPLVHLVGALAIFVFRVHPMALTMVANLVFVPLLAFGCYGVGKTVRGPWAGLLAGLFALGTPMIASEMHHFYLDPAEAAMVAVSVWALLASRRFERLGISALAGALCGLALLTKETAAVFLIGMIATMLVRGGWRSWKGLIFFVFALENVAGPWYVYHYTELTQTFSQVGNLVVSGVQSPPRWSLRGFSWYFWDLLNEQALLPLTIAFLVGAAVAVRRCLRDRLRPENVLPELLIGGLVGYLAVSYLRHKDPRYTLPILVYVAVLGTFWIPSIARSRLRTGVTVAIVAIAALNFAGMSFGIGGTQRVMLALPGAESNMIFPWQLTLYENVGWLRGGPQHDGDVRGLLTGLHKTGITAIAMDPDVNEIDFSILGIGPVAESVNVAVLAAPAAGPQYAYLLLHTPGSRDPRPCQRLNDGSGVYVVSGSAAGLNAQLLRDPSNPKQRYSLICPGRATIRFPG